MLSHHLVVYPSPRSEERGERKKDHIRVGTNIQAFVISVIEWLFHSCTVSFHNHLSHIASGLDTVLDIGEAVAIRTDPKSSLVELIFQNAFDFEKSQKSFAVKPLRWVVKTCEIQLLIKTVSPRERCHVRKTTQDQ